MAVEVAGAQHRMQMMFVDTGSPHTYLVNLSRLAVGTPVLGGYRGTRISPGSFARSIDASQVNFADNHGVIFKGWVRRNF
jgi:hypothetical protein